MRLSFSVAARNRAFSKAMQRIDSRFQPLINEFESIELEHPIHEAILVGITDDRPAGFFEEVKTNDSHFQVLAGCSLCGSDDELVDDVFNILQKATRLCPFTTADHETFESLFARLRVTVLSSEGKDESQL